MPTDARPLVVAVEKIVNDPLQETSSGYYDSTQYIAALPEVTGNFRADQLRQWYLHRAEMLAPLRGSERSYVIDRSIKAVLEIGFLLGDLKHDHRH